jgi:CRP-like cAMP-binding protein
MTTVEPPVPLNGSKLFGLLDADGRKRLMAAAQRIRVAPDELVLREGEVPDAMFIVLQGELRVAAERLGGDSADMATLGPGDVFGEIGVLTGEPRTATVTAVDEVWVMRLGADEVRAVIRDHPEITGDLMRLGLKRSEATLAEVMRDEDG